MSLNKAIACMKEIGFKPKLNSFEKRLIMQKTIFLLEQKGINMNFEYSLYIRGPYSPSLTAEMYQNQKMIEELQTTEKLSAQEKEKISEFKDIFGELKPSILEVASTYAYFAYKQKQNPLDATKHVKEMKNFCTETQIALGVSKTKQFLYQPTKQEINEMKKEHAAWENTEANFLE